MYRSKVLASAVVAVAVATVALLVGYAPHSSAAAAPHRTDCAQRVFAAPVHGRAALTQLGSRIDSVALSRGFSTTHLHKALASDPTLWLDSCGYPFYRDRAIVSGAASSTPRLAFPANQTFLLNSRPNSQRTLYLNFVGDTITNTAWNVQSMWTMPSGYHLIGYDTDSNPATFSTSELGVIQSVWQRVAEDYATFDVNVTTQPPAAGAIDRTSLSDQTYGTSVDITSDPALATACGCGGISWVGNFDDAAQHAVYQPALVFSQNLGNGTNAKYIAEAAAHEAGHTLGLSHDGTSTSEYYQPSAGHLWGAIMGAAYNTPLSQWSRGEYFDANNQQDDLAIIASHGATPIADTVGNSAATASALGSSLTATSLINNANDSDWYSFSADGSTSITATPSAVSPDLDIALSLYDANGALVTSSDPTAAYVSEDVASGLNASITRTLPAGIYYVEVQGTGNGDPTGTTGYSNYASIGPYTLSVTLPTPVIDQSPLDTAFAGSPYTTTLTASGGSPPYSWSLTQGSLPPGLTLAPSTGVISGTPTAAGDYPFSVQVTDGVNQTSTRDLTLTVSSVTTTASAPLNVNAGRGVRSLAISWQVPSSDGGAAIDSYTATASPGGASCTTATTSCTISGLVDATAYDVTVTAHNARGSSVASDAATATTFAAPSVPGLPVAVPGNASIEVSWESAYSDGGLPILRFTATAHPGTASCSSATKLACTITGLTNGTAYTVTLVASNAVGDSGASEPSGSTIPYTMPSRPTSVRVSARAHALVVSWHAPYDGGYPITSYLATTFPDPHACTTSGRTSCVITGLTNGIGYRVTVTAFTEMGDSPESSQSNRATPMSTPHVSVHASAHQFTVTISNTDGVRSVRPWLQVQQGATWRTLSKVRAVALNASHSRWRISTSFSRKTRVRIYVPRTSRTLAVTTAATSA